MNASLVTIFMFLHLNRSVFVFSTFPTNHATFCIMYTEYNFFFQTVEEGLKITIKYINKIGS